MVMSPEAKALALLRFCNGNKWHAIKHIATLRSVRRSNAAEDEDYWNAVIKLLLDNGDALDPNWAGAKVTATYSV
jgi:hypothetical protein